MAKSGAVWGIDLGGCALKALRCRPHDKDATRVVAESFDYIEYPKILSQPEADRNELIREALETFASRNDTRNDAVAISVPGQSGLARFIKLPPVEAKKIPDIVKYEARQQIPFALEDVVWDYQQLAGSSEEEGFALETEVGLFAMKRDQVTRSLEPFEDAGIRVDYIQLAPLAIYNYVCFDRMSEIVSQPYDAANPANSTVVISLGTETTDLVITNGFRVWQRNIPIGGNHFTKALSKELKLTFGKAEHLKRHAAEADDPKAAFQAMRPVFSDLLAEIQRSIGYFASIDKTAKIGEVVAVGNTLKLPGLQRYLAQNLDQEVRAIDSFEHLTGGSVMAGPQFKENVLTFPVCYGLCLQAMGRAEISTNLLPEEIITQRLVAQKKPWAVAAVAAILVGCTVNYVAGYSQWKSADLEQPEFQQAISQSKSVQTRSSGFQSKWQSIKTEVESVAAIDKNLVSNVEGRLLWLELLKGLDAALPHDARPPSERKNTEEDFARREELHITRMDCQKFPDLSIWYTSIAERYKAEHLSEPPPPEPAESAPTAAEGEEGVAATEGAVASDDAPAEETAPAVTDPADVPPGGAVAGGGFGMGGMGGMDGTGGDFGDPASGEAGGADALSGEGWVIELQGYHYHNGSHVGKQDEGPAFVQRTLIDNLKNGTVMLPDGPGGELIAVPLKDLGISHPVLYDYSQLMPVILNLDMIDTGDGNVINNSPFLPEVGDGYEPAATDDAVVDTQPKRLELKKFEFIVQFAWKPTPRSERAAIRAGEAPQGSPDDTVTTGSTNNQIAQTNRD